ncbi:hypothetical protein QNM99_23040 [Pseudomonas sp. PCH446]
MIQGGTDKAFSGLIFQRQDATFVATLPTTGKVNRFKNDSPYPLTETGIASFPAGYQLYAVYRSNISLSAIKEQNAGQPDRSSTLSEQESRLRQKSITPTRSLRPSSPGRRGQGVLCPDDQCQYHQIHAQRL